MGRPRLNVVRVLVGLPPAVLDRIDQLCGKQQRGAFIRKAVEAAIRDTERRIAKAERQLAADKTGQD